MSVIVGVKNNFYGYLQFPTDQSLRENAVRVVNVVKGIALTIFNYCKALYFTCLLKLKGQDAFADHMVSAAERGDGPYVKTLLHFPGIGNSFVSDALDKAVRFGHLEVVKIIVQDIRANRHFLSYQLMRNEHITLINNAVNFRHHEVLRFILKEFHPSYFFCFNLMRLLNYYLHQGDLVGVKTIIDCYGEISVKTDLAENVKELVDNAVNSGNHEVLRFITTKFTWKYLYLGLYDLLEKYINEGNLEKVKIFIEYFSKRSDKDNLYETPFPFDGILLKIAQLEHTSILKYVFKHIRLSVDDCNLALRAAALKGNVEFMAFLVQYCDQKGYHRALEYESGTRFNEAMVLLPFSSQEGRLEVLRNGVTLVKHSNGQFVVLINPNKVAPLLPRMPIPDMFLRTTINLNRCRTDGQLLEFEDAKLKLKIDSIRQIALKKGSTLLAFRRVVAMNLADSKKIKPGLFPESLNQIWLKRFFPLIEYRIFYGHQDLFRAKNLTCGIP
jgi:hypothetical protein